MGKKEAKYISSSNERICRLDLDTGELEVEGMEREKCKKLLRSLLEE